MASNKREMYAERKGRCEGGEKVGGGGYFFVNNQEKTRGNRQNMNYKKLGMEGGGGARW